MLRGSRNAWISAGARSNSSYLRDGQTWNFPVPSTPGSYELRVFTKNDSNGTRAQALFGIISFQVGLTGSTDYRISVVPGKSLTVKRGRSAALKVYATPKAGGVKIAANNIVTFQSVNSRIAVVGPDGVVRGVKRGNTTIKVISGTTVVKIKVTVK